MDKNFNYQQETLKAHNQLIKIYTGGTTHNRRLLTNEEMYKIQGIEYQVPIIKQPICEHCERVVMWDWEIQNVGGRLVEIPLARCVHCGTITKNPLTYGEFLLNGYDMPSNMSPKQREQGRAARALINMMFNMKGRNGIIENET